MAIWQTSRPTVIDSRTQGRHFLNRRFRFPGFGKGRGPHRGFECFPVVALSFFCLPRLRVFENFFVSALDCPFQVFTLESCSFFPFSFFLFSSFFIILLCTWKFIPNRWMVYQEFWLRKRDNNPVDYKKFLKEKSLQSEYPYLIKMDFSDT